MVVTAVVWLCAAAAFWGYLLLRKYPHILAHHCPTAEDLKDGIVLDHRLDRGPVRLYYRHKEGSVYWRTRKDEISREWSKTERYMGLLSLVSRSVKTERERKWSYSDGWQKLFPLVSGKAVSFTGISEPEGKISSTNYHIRVAEPYKKSVGRCSYEVYPLHFTERWTYATGRVKTVESVKHYSPELAHVLSIDFSRFAAFKVDVVRKPSLLERLEWPFSEDRPFED